MARETLSDSYVEHKLDHVRNETPFEYHGRCYKCIYWQSLKDGFPSADFNPRGKKGDKIGECRSQSPAIINSETQWPITYDLDWCGQYKARAGKGGLSSV